MIVAVHKQGLEKDYRLSPKSVKKVKFAGVLKPVKVPAKTMRVVSHSVRRINYSPSVLAGYIWFVVRRGDKLVVMDGTVYFGDYLVHRSTREEAIQYCKENN